MKRNLLLMLALAACIGQAVAQNKLRIGQHPVVRSNKPAEAALRPLTGFEPSTPAPVSVPQAENLLGEQVMGSTLYDQQTNSSMPNRMYLWPDGRVSGVWNQSLGGASGFPDRGTGYNKSNTDREFPDPPMARVEDERTGFPAYDVTSTGEEWIVTHNSATAGRIHYAHKSDTDTDWTEGNLPQAPETQSVGHSWPRIAVGGNDGQTLHVIALTTPTGSGGALVDGLDGQVRYWRSQNGGADWDVVDIPVPGIDTSTWLGVNGDAYAIDAEGETVAILIMSLFNDAVVIKSIDNGTTWDEPRVVHEFPLERFGIDAYLYTFEDIAEFYQDFFPDSLAILSTDETGNVFVDPVGTVHVALPTMFIKEDDLTNELYTYYPGFDVGIIYWNDEMDDDAGQIVAYSPDLDGDTIWGTAASQIYATGYGESFSAVPTMGQDDEGRLYMTFVAHHELNFDEETNEHWRQPFIVASEPFDFSQWSDPRPVLQPSVVNDTIVVALSEYYFPVMAKRVDDGVHLQLQHDYERGIALRAQTTPMENTIEYVYFPRELAVGTNSPARPAVVLALSPNPASDARTTVLFELAVAGDTRLDVLDVAGALVRTHEQGRLNAGQHQASLDLAGLSNGLYFVRVQSGNQSGVRKLVVAK